MHSATDDFEFSDNFIEDVLPERLDFEEIPVDPNCPGFASLLPACLAVYQGQAENHLLEAYLAGLMPRLDDARAQLQRLEIPEEVYEQVAPAILATQAVLEELAVVLNLIDQYLAYANGETLQEAIERLARVHHELKNAL